MGQPKLKVLGFGIDARREGERWEWDTDRLHWIALPAADGQVQLIGQDGDVRVERTQLPDLKAAGWYSEGFDAALRDSLPIRSEGDVKGGGL